MARRENLLEDTNDDITPDDQSPPVGFEPATPDYRTPTYEETPSWSTTPESVTKTPTYAPDVSPPYAPDYVPTSPTYQPTSPTYQPTDESPPFAPELPPEFNVGENVLLRGGSHDPRTNWDVVKIGTNLITLRGPNGEIEIAQKGDLYRPSDIVQAPIHMQDQTHMIQQDTTQMQYQPQQQPGINIAPIFNFGTMETTGNIDKSPAVVKCNPEPTSIAEIDGGDSGSRNGDKKSDDGPIDFNRLIIKKV